MVDAFFWFIGSYNLFGAVLLLFCLSERGADLVLGKTLQIVRRPYTHGEHGPMWIWFSISTTLFLGMVVLAARTWPDDARAWVALAVAVCYGSSLIPAVAAARSPRYDWRGLAACWVLWVAQAGWALAVWHRLR